MEDYKTFVPYQTLAELYKNEKSATYESYKKYQETYYPEWKPEFEQYVKAQAPDIGRPDFAKTAWCNALTYQMIYEQPVVYEMHNIAVPALLIVGDKDRMVVGKNLLTDAEKAAHGLYSQLAQHAKEMFKDCSLVILPGVGHIPHIQEPQKFKEALYSFLE